MTTLNRTREVRDQVAALAEHPQLTRPQRRHVANAQLNLAWAINNMEHNDKGEATHDRD